MVNKVVYATMTVFFHRASRKCDLTGIPWGTVQYRKKNYKLKSKLPHTVSPLDVLYKAMIRYESQIPTMFHTIYELIKAEQPAIAAKIALALEKSQDKAIDAAAKLAPFKAARLQSIEVNAKITKRYVVRSPSIIPNTQNWLSKVAQEQKALPKPNLTPNGLDKETPEDIDFIDINAES